MYNKLKSKKNVTQELVDLTLLMGYILLFIDDPVIMRRTKKNVANKKRIDYVLVNTGICVTIGKALIFFNGKTNAHADFDEKPREFSFRALIL